MGRAAITEAVGEGLYNAKIAYDTTGAESAIAAIDAEIEAIDAIIEEAENLLRAAELKVSEKQTALDDTFTDFNTEAEKAMEDDPEGVTHPDGTETEASSKFNRITYDLLREIEEYADKVAEEMEELSKTVVPSPVGTASLSFTAYAPGWTGGTFKIEVSGSYLSLRGYAPTWTGGTYAVEVSGGHLRLTAYDPTHEGGTLFEDEEPPPDPPPDPPPEEPVTVVIPSATFAWQVHAPEGIAGD